MAPRAACCSRQCRTLCCRLALLSVLGTANVLLLFYAFPSILRSPPLAALLGGAASLTRLQPTADPGLMEGSDALRPVVEAVVRQNKIPIVVHLRADDLPLLDTWMSLVRRIQLEDSLVFLAGDQEAYAAVQQRWPLQALLVGEGRQPGQGMAPAAAVSDGLLASLLSLVELNVSFVTSTIDVLWLQDPFPHFSGSFDVWIMEDAATLDGLERRFAGGSPAPPVLRWEHQLSPGLMMVHPTPASRRLVSEWRARTEAQCSLWGSCPDRRIILNEMLMDDGDGPRPEVQIGVLPVVKFPSGCLFFKMQVSPCCDDELRKGFLSAINNSTAGLVAVHNNWLSLVDHKLLRIKELDALLAGVE